MSLNAQQLAAQKNLSWVLAEKLAQQILRGEYAPGCILPGEIELGEQFGVSRTAVREAVKTLTAKGMVLPRPRIGTRVMPKENWNFLDKELLVWWMSEDNFHEVIQHFLIMRNSLEPQACQLAAQLGSAEQKAHLNTLMEEMVYLKKHFNRDRWIEVDMSWHEHIYTMSANPFLISFATLFHSIYHTYFTSITQDQAIKLDLHQAIVDAIQESDGDSAFQACQTLLKTPNAPTAK
ncbi:MULTISPECIES: FadR/GntR family transcriptional regulator [Enterobacteriaceae]|jgi:DNA-binding FadR family transcriptional regulator|uniref:FadR/GntR family transcriptional regulator n=2 Tax=Enterobacteriaceae TaxID=543 RepID=A0ABW1Q513_9ENTR|nr:MULTISPECIES: FadR/GntR family transcriptional regulator [Phytobacter]AUU88482.1 FadR family transcriptional regulator [Enterobacteriaceae bacterium ENNIH3]AUV06227.1 FadR family transcriptional regulator [Enterobacteriaceae bacterium ENNIH2]MBS6737832.1 FadR family transcriptional regulator [Enterobacteriaceae bacterium]PTA97360.1 FadR family transcriptional regulator [Kluyvera sp. Nf5]PWF52882.1 FadR family transcriptional regulator [[Kluyvera] intestini]PXW52936.1 GntR family transcript